MKLGLIRASMLSCKHVLILLVRKDTALKVTFDMLA
jgi:hypothetical protein